MRAIGSNGAALAVIIAALAGGGCVASVDAPSVDAPSAAVAALEDDACGGVPEALALGVAPPVAPAETSPPLGAGTCHAWSTETLYDRVHDPACTDVILRDGVYEAAAPVTTYLTFVHPKRLWAVHPGTVTLRFGVNIAQHPGSELHGLVIDIDDPLHAPPVGPYSDRNAVMFWGTAEDVVIEDCIIRGNGVIHRGINAAQPNGLTIGRVVVEDFLRFGIRIPYKRLTGSRAGLSDVVVNRVGDPAWHSLARCEGSNPDLSTCFAPGTQEHGIWIGFPTRLERARVRDVYWTGIITASHPNVVRDVLLRDIDVDRVGDGSDRGPGAAIGFEKITHDLTLERFCVGPSIREGVHAEWDNLDDFASSAQRLRIHHGVISAEYMGLYFDKGTRHSLLRDLHIRNAQWLGVGLHMNYLECIGDPLPPPEVCNTTEWSGLTFDLPDGVCEITFSHPIWGPFECYQPQP